MYVCMGVCVCIYIYIHIYIYIAKLLQSCPDSATPVDCSPLGSSVHGILWRARILEWGAVSSSNILY